MTAQQTALWMLPALVCWACGGSSVPRDAATRDAATRDAATDAPPDAAPPDAAPPDATPPLDDRPWKGPWVIRTDVDRASVVWETRLAVDSPTVAFEPEEGGGLLRSAEGTSDPYDVRATYGVGSPLVDEPDPPGIFYLNTVELTGLSPASCYRYAIDGYPEHGGRLCTMHEPHDHSTPIAFYVVGDTNPALMNTGRILAAGKPERSEFAIHVGDLQYYTSLIETYQVWFPLMERLLSAGAMFPCVGNHEFEIDGEFEDYYKRFWRNPGQDGDSIRYHFATGGVHFFSLSTEHELLEGSEQYEWLTARLAEVEALPDYRFSIVFLHRPLFTVGDSHPVLEIRAALMPVLQRHNVPLVLAGHMHGYERFEVGEITFVTTGNGGAVRDDVDANIGAYPDDAALRVASGRFFESMRILIEGDTIHGSTVDDLGMVQDSFDKTVPLGPRDPG